MKKLIEFNPGDCPQNMGSSQLCDNVADFVDERIGFFLNAKITTKKLTFDIPTGDKKKPFRTGFATITSVEDDFKNYTEPKKDK